MQFRESQAIYLQIAEYVCEKVLLKEWEPAARIPSVRELAVHLEVNPNTVMRTYEFLQQQEIIFNQRGIGFFIAADAVQKVKNYSKERFLGQELPELFKSMYLLGISVEDIAERFEIFKAQNYQTK